MFLSNSRIQFLLTGELDDQLVGKAYNGRSAAAESSLHAVMIGTVGAGYRNPAAGYGDLILPALGCFHRKGLIHMQVNGFDKSSLRADFGKIGAFAWGENPDAQEPAHQ